jgi:hypothetical protein
MSKKKVQDALQAIRNGDMDAVFLIVRTIDGAFLKKRLMHLISSSSEEWAPARQLWLQFFTESPPDPIDNNINKREISCSQAIEPSNKNNIISIFETNSTAVESPRKLSIEDPGSVLCWLSDSDGKTIDLDSIQVAHVWGLVGLSCLARQERENHIHVINKLDSNASRFAHAVGITDVIKNKTPESPGEPGRTVKLRRITDFAKVESSASEIATLLFPDVDDADTRKTVQYVVVELLRNVLQHSQDPLGGIAAAQLMQVGPLYSEIPCVQVAVGDCGIGIHHALREKHPDVNDSKVALEKALWPHISGMFEEGLTGSGQNAGMGLFFISEMTKLTGGKLFISSKTDTLFLEADPKDPDRHTLKFLDKSCRSYPGTLVVFELPLGSVADYDSLIDTIRKRARERTPQRAKHSWIRYERLPQDAKHFLVKMTSEDTVAAEKFAQENLIPLIMKRQKIILDFRQVEIATQSYLHALLFETLRLAWAMRTYIYVVNASPSVKSGLDLLQNYALGG